MRPCFLSVYSGIEYEETIQFSEIVALSPPFRCLNSMWTALKFKYLYLQSSIQVILYPFFNTNLSLNVALLARQFGDSV